MPTVAEPQPTRIPGITRGLDKDIYVVFAGFTRDGATPIIKAYINPLTTWVWIGGWVVAFGTLIALIPSKVRRVNPRTRVVGTVAKEPKVAATR